MSRVNYGLSNLVIPGYVCGECGRKHVKLWRYRGVMVSHQELKCVVCACRLAGVNYRTVNSVGVRRATQYGITANTNCIGDMAPAVPSDVSGGLIVNYWGYGALAGRAKRGAEWWRALPLM